MHSKAAAKTGQDILNVHGGRDPPSHDGAPGEDHGGPSAYRDQLNAVARVNIEAATAGKQECLADPDQLADDLEGRTWRSSSQGNEGEWGEGQAK